MRQRQRERLLGAALEQARDALLASLGKDKFATLYTAVMEADANDGRGCRGKKRADTGVDSDMDQALCGGEQPGWGANEHGWQMLQYIYLEEETKRLRDTLKCGTV